MSLGPCGERDAKRTWLRRGSIILPEPLALLHIANSYNDKLPRTPLCHSLTRNYRVFPAPSTLFFMSSAKTIAKNTAWLLIATTGQKLLAFLAFAIAARLVGPTVTGEYFFSVAVTSTFVILADLGMTPVVIRSIASGKKEGKRLFGAALRLKFLLIPVAILASFIFIGIRNVNEVIIVTTAIMTLVMSADSIHLVFYGALRGSQQLRFEAMGMFIGQALSAITAVSAAILGWGAPGLALALLMGSVWNVGWSWAKAARQGVLPEVPKKGDLASLARQAVPFALAGIFVKIYSYLDTLTIQYFHGEKAVGDYSVAYKSTYAFQFIPLVFIAALYPAMSSVFAKNDKAELQKVFAGSLRIMAIVAAPIAAGLSAIAPQFVTMIYGHSFLGSVAALTVLPWVLLPIFIDFPVGSLLNASHRAHLKTTAMGGAMIVNAVLNFLLVPLMGPVGAAWAAVVSFWFLLFAGICFCWKMLPSVSWFFWLLARALASGAAVWFAVRMFGKPMPFPLIILFGAAVAGVALLATKLLTIQELRNMVRWLAAKVRGNMQDEEELHEEV